MEYNCIKVLLPGVETKGIGIARSEVAREIESS